MKKVRKKEGKMVKAYCLDGNNNKIKELISTGKIVQTDENHWKVFSREATEGEVAETGDYIKIDSNGYPYPNSREFFLSNHRALGGDDYEQIPQILTAWSLEEGMCPEIKFLLSSKGFEMNENDAEKYFSAPLWGDVLTAAKDARIVFYDLSYDEKGNVTDADFNFVAKDEFDKVYDEL